METNNYKLSLCGDAQGNFIEWRKSINGPGNSNMTKIDAALAENALKITEVESAVTKIGSDITNIGSTKADASFSVIVNIPAAGWSESGNSYSQEVSVEGLTADANGTISLAHSANAAEREAARNAMLSISGQNDGKLTITADGDVPTIDISAVVIVLG